MTEPPFGLRLFEELKRLGGLALVTSRLDYGQIQRLKAAEREELAPLFRGSGYHFLQRLKTDTPEQVADLMARTLQAQRRDGDQLMLFGLLLMS